MKEGKVEQHTITLRVDNEAGVLARVVGFFSGRGYNIESLAVAEMEGGEHISLLTVVTRGTPRVVELIKAQLSQLVPVRSIHDFTVSGNAVMREMALVKVVSEGVSRVEALRLKDAFRAHIIDSTVGSFIFEIVGDSSKIDAFIELMRPLGLKSVSRTGVVAACRGAEDFWDNK